MLTGHSATPRPNCAVSPASRSNDTAVRLPTAGTCTSKVPNLAPVAATQPDGSTIKGPSTVAQTQLTTSHTGPNAVPGISQVPPRRCRADTSADPYCPKM